MSKVNAFDPMQFGTPATPTLCFSDSELHGETAAKIGKIFGRVTNYPFIKTPPSSQYSFWAAFPEGHDAVLTVTRCEDTGEWGISLWEYSQSKFKEQVKSSEELDFSRIIDQCRDVSFGELLPHIVSLMETNGFK